MHAVQVEPPLLRYVPMAAGASVIALAGSLPVLCPFRMWSGHACPLCGMTRAVSSFVQGDVVTAMKFHPLVVLVLVQIAVLGFIAARSGTRPPDQLVQRLAIVNGSAFAVAWIVRWRLGLLDFVLS